MPTRYLIEVPEEDEHRLLTEIEPCISDDIGAVILERTSTRHDDDEVQSVDQEIVHIAECQIHGLHGERTECFVCGGPVKQVALTRVKP